jgi:hypothetical protein
MIEIGCLQIEVDAQRKIASISAQNSVVGKSPLQEAPRQRRERVTRTHAKYSHGSPPFGDLALKGKE